MKRIADFIRNKDGATAVEYGLIVTFIGIAVLTSMGTLGPAVRSVFTTISSTMN